MKTPFYTLSIDRITKPHEFYVKNIMIRKKYCVREDTHKKNYFFLVVGPLRVQGALSKKTKNCQNPFQAIIRQEKK